jgi:RNA polymerase sigma-70 factor (ECF subfamily)
MAVPFTTFEDGTLIELALAGQAEGFAVLMDRHAGAVRKRIVSMVANASDADDLLQEVLLKVWQHLSQFRSESTFRTWMTRVATNEVLQSYRRERRNPVCHAAVDIATLASPCESPLNSLARVEVILAVRSAVAILPARHREIVVLRDFSQVSTRETAKRLRTTIPAAKSRLVRARIMLAGVLQQAGIRGMATRATRNVPDLRSRTVHSDAIPAGR